MNRKEDEVDSKFCYQVENSDMDMQEKAIGKEMDDKMLVENEPNIHEQNSFS
jgi:hypothetical protein